MLFRIIIAIAILIGVLALVRRLRTMFGSGERPRAIEAKMARCAYCDVYFPRDDGVTRNGRSYCSGPHAQQGGDS